MTHQSGEFLVASIRLDISLKYLILDILTLKYLNALVKKTLVNHSHTFFLLSFMYFYSVIRRTYCLHLLSYEGLARRNLCS